tara:strand:+ start:36 stop:209 length:174 start_codon:yes stop_codon:yes gene_type:complete
MFVAGIFVDNQLAPQAHLSKVSYLQLQEKLLPLPGEGGFSRQMTEKTEGVPANGSEI